MLQSIPLLGYPGGLLIFMILFLGSLNLAVGTPILALIAERQKVASNDAHYRLLAGSLVKTAMPLLCLGTVAGLPLLFSIGSYFDPFYRGILGPFSRLGMIGVVLLCTTMALLYLFFLSCGRPKKGYFFHFLLGLAASLSALLLTLFCHLIPSFLLVPTAEFRLNGSVSLGEIVFNQLMLPLYVHAVVASLAFTGLMIMLVAAYQKDFNRRQPREYYQKAFKFGGRWALNATLFQLIPGGWIFFSLPQELKDAVMGGALTGWFVAALICTFIGLLLLLKMLKDNLVNSRATTIVTILLLAAMILMQTTTTRLQQPQPADGLTTSISDRQE
ncbi:MAG: cytochrome ubiquinol oxidase subunit I [Deltaproteobacteria bacterium]|nr:cytochrome ubiquinol oxidase subunit I [Candidatus Anaeroferrophillus wilburensis]MBN2889846.1 cytochrome ubiquinol oxidase subunit I [Deltaproteobacteria bacterium]